MREKVTDALVTECEEKHMAHAVRLPLQGVWTTWTDSARPFDLSWRNLITTAPSLIKFVLNAQINCVRTPDMLKLWGYTQTATCPLCGAVQCTLHHILVNCKFALEQKRYTWRHDSVLKNIEASLVSLVADFSRRKPRANLKATRDTFNACFVRTGETKKRASRPPERLMQSVLECANDWRLSVDFDAKKAEFPPSIVATPLRPDIVLWSRMSRVVVLIELTCPAEEGMVNAQLRKENKYSGLLDEINATEVWKPVLFTLEVGARGLVGLSSHKTFVRLGFTSSQAKALCKRLSAVVVRCSYAIYQAHNNLFWSHNHDLIVIDGASRSITQGPSATEADVETVLQPTEKKVPHCKNIRALRDNGVQSLFHFTDSSNLESISKRGLLTWKKLGEQQIDAKMSSSELSRRLDTKAGLADFVRLSFCKKHPMMYRALKEGRISRPVVLEIKLEVVSRPGVLFSAVNAASPAAKASEDASVIHFETVKADSQYSLAASEKSFFQGEVLVPDWIPPHLIKIPNVDAFAKSLELRGRLPDSALVGCTSNGDVGVKVSKPFSTTSPLLPIASGAGSSTPEPSALPSGVYSAGVGKSIHETFVAPKVLGKISGCVVGLEPVQVSIEREQKLAKPVECEQPPSVVTALSKSLSWATIAAKPFATNALSAKPTTLSEPPSVKPPTAKALSAKPPDPKALTAAVRAPLTAAVAAKERFEEACGCQMSVSMQVSCMECQRVGHLMNCRLHMTPCTASAWHGCGVCLRILCWEHRSCYCQTRVVGIGGVAVREREEARAREIVREQEEIERVSES
jgi:hypothetical protein